MKKISSARGLEPNLEISVKLALVLGWKIKRMRVDGNTLLVGQEGMQTRSVFDYRDPTLLWPLAVMYDAFPFESASPMKTEWIASSGKAAQVNSSRGASPEMASALAIIEASKTFKPAR